MICIKNFYYFLLLLFLTFLIVISSKINLQTYPLLRSENLQLMMIRNMENNTCFAFIPKLFLKYLIFL